MVKYDLIPEQLLYEGTITSENLYAPDTLNEATILRTHTAEYWNKLRHGGLSPKEIRRTGFPYSPTLIDREATIPDGTRQNALFAQQYGVAINVAGGTHHAYADRGEGFCLLNDIAIAANWMLDHEKARQVLVVDLDVHQGNGTARIFENDPRVFTFSMHGASNYPLHKEKSDLDIALPDKTDDAAYLRQLTDTLPRLIDQVQPDLVFYLAGVDVLATDALGKLSLSREGCKQRDAYVLKLCKENKLPVSVALGGGYSPDIRDILEAHCNTFRLAQEIFF